MSTHHDPPHPDDPLVSDNEIARLQAKAELAEQERETLGAIQRAIARAKRLRDWTPREGGAREQDATDAR